jgi:hypothetical protein
VRADGRAQVLARLTASAYLRAAGEVVWVGMQATAMHPRAILLTSPRAIEADAVRVDVSGGSRPWRPGPPALDATAVRRLAAGWRRLVGDGAALGTPAGFGALAMGGPLAWPLDRARPAAEALIRACACDDPDAALEAAGVLLGVGGGLTPSGDDYVGGALFARHLLAAAGRTDVAGWRRTAEAILARAAARTHPISVVLLADLAAGRGWASLHAVAGALAAGAADDALAAARQLTALGQATGWDVLAGLGAGLGVLVDGADP